MNKGYVVLPFLVRAISKNIFPSMRSRPDNQEGRGKPVSLLEQTRDAGSEPPGEEQQTSDEEIDSSHESVQFRSSLSIVGPLYFL
jgi:hypothetical protein